MSLTIEEDKFRGTVVISEREEISNLVRCRMQDLFNKFDDDYGNKFTRRLSFILYRKCTKSNLLETLLCRRNEYQDKDFMNHHFFKNLDHDVMFILSKLFLANENVDLMYTYC